MRRRTLPASLGLLTTIALSAASLSGQAPRGAVHPGVGIGADSGSTGVIILAHGGDAGWNALVREVAAQVTTGGPVEVAFLMGPEASKTRFQDVARAVADRGVREIVVVPLLMSSYSGHYDQVRWLAGQDVPLDSAMRRHLHHAGIDRARVTIPMRVAAALDDAPELARVLAVRARALAPSVEDRALFIVGHGPNGAEDYVRWMENGRQLADSVKAIAGFRDVRFGLVRDDAPAPVRAEAVRGVRDLIELQAAMTGREVVVVPMLISTGHVSRSKLPADLAGLPILYAPAGVAPHPEIARWVERRIAGR